MNKCIEYAWSVRGLERQISTLYYEHLLSSQNQKPVREEAQEKIQQLHINLKDYLRDPYILDFLNLPNSSVL